VINHAQKKKVINHYWGITSWALLLGVQESGHGFLATLIVDSLILWATIGQI